MLTRHGCMSLVVVARTVVRMATLRKERTDAPDGFFEFEAAGLRWLAEAQSAGGARMVTVRDAGSGFIELERLQTVGASAAAAESFGRALAVTHAAGAAAFGSPPAGWTGDGWIGSQTQPMNPTPTWGLFYAEQRVRPFVRRARDNGNLDDEGVRRLDRVCDRIAAGEFDDDAPPARLHGDLWSGNVLFTADGVVLIPGGARRTWRDGSGDAGIVRLPAARSDPACLCRGGRIAGGLAGSHVAAPAASGGSSCRFPWTVVRRAAGRDRTAAALGRDVNNLRCSTCQREKATTDWSAPPPEPHRCGMPPLATSGGDRGGPCSQRGLPTTLPWFAS